MTDPRFLLMAIGGMGFGIWSFFKAFAWLKEKHTIEAIPTSKVRSLAMGIVEISGHAVPEVKGKKRQTLVCPFTKKECVYYHWTIEEYRKQGKNSKWVTVKSEEKRLPFFLEDETGRVLVDPQGASIESPMCYESQSQWGKDPEPEVLRFLQEQSIPFEGLFGANKTMRYREYRIEPDEKLYIIGTAGHKPVKISSASNAELIMIQKGDGAMYLISEHSEKEVLSGLRWKVALGFWGGGALFVACLAFALWFFGLL